MPREKIELKGSVDHIAILDEDGEVDDELVPELNEDNLRDMHRYMLLARRFDERLLNLQRQGRIGTFAPIKGQEAAQVGSAFVLKKTDWVVPSYRETAVQLTRGAPMDGIFVFLAGYNEGEKPPLGSRDLPGAVPVGSQTLHAVGLAYGRKIRGLADCVMTYFGDGATSQGDVHEALNFAQVFETPVIFLCQNNQWAISVPREHQTKSKTLAQKAHAYGMDGIQVDGNDVLAVYLACREALERARENKSPTFIECLTYRMEVHTTADDPTRYRDEREVEKWDSRDPIARFQTYLKNRDILSDKKVDDLEAEIKEDIEAAWSSAQDQIESYEDPTVIFDHVFAEAPKALQKQRSQFIGLHQLKGGAHE